MADRASTCCTGDCNQGRRCPLIPPAPLVPPCRQRRDPAAVAAILRVLFVVLVALFSTVLYVHFAENQTHEVTR